MADRNNPNECLEDGSVSHQSSTAELPDIDYLEDDEFLDYWAQPLPDEDVSQEQFIPFPGDSNNENGLNMNTPHHADFGQDLDHQHELQAIQAFRSSVGGNTSLQNIHGSKQSSYASDHTLTTCAPYAPYTLYQIPAPCTLGYTPAPYALDCTSTTYAPYHTQAPYTSDHTLASFTSDQIAISQQSHNGVESNETPQCEIADQLWENLERSIPNINKFDILLDQVPNSQFGEWIDLSHTAEELHESHANVDASLSEKANLLDPSAELDPADNSLLYLSQESQIRFINPSFVLNADALNIGQPKNSIEEYLQAPHKFARTPPDNYFDCNPTPISPQHKEHKAPIKTVNKRRANIQSVVPSKYYPRLPNTLLSWNAHGKDNVTTFRYNEYGNLCPEDKFSPARIMDYLSMHYLNSRENVYNSKNGRLTLWIQSVPADSGSRYPAKNSDKCRFADCPIPNGSVRKGFFRVAFDEHTGSGRLVDPYHCAGYVHLFCLEKFCDFPQICKLFNVQPDQRELAEGKNKMAITRDHHELAEVVLAFLQRKSEPHIREYEHTLNYQLTCKHLELQCPTREKSRKERGGNHIAIHKGNLDIFMLGEREKKRRTAPKVPKRQKRKRDLTGEEDCQGNSFTHEERPIKQPRFR